MSIDRYLAGVGGIPNFGDEFINRTWLDFLGSRYPDDSVVISTGKPSNVAALQRSSPARFYTSSLFADLVARSGKRAKTFQQRADWIDSKLKYLGTPEWDLAISQIKAQGSSIHFMGGGYLNSDWQSRYLFLQIASTLKSEAGVSIFGTGLGLTPFDHSLDEWIGTRLSEFDYAEARDSFSAEEAGVVSGIDDAWLAFREGADRVKRLDSPPPFVINIQTDYSGEYLDRMVVAGVDAIRSSNRYSPTAPVAVAEAFPSKDGWLYKRLRQELPNPIEFLTFQRLWEEGLPAGDETTWITTRFHFHLLAAALGSDGIALSGGKEFYDVKHRSLLDAGTGWTYANVALDEPSHPLRAQRSVNFDSTVKDLAARKLAVAGELYPSALRTRERNVVVGKTRFSEPFIGVVTHKDCVIPEDAVYRPIAVGADQHNVSVSGQSELFYDDTEDSIAERNPGYCELTAMYWMWKNVRAPIKGLVHYRRFLKGVGSSQPVSGQEIESLLGQYDLLVPYRWIVKGAGLNNVPKTVANQYGRAHAPGDLIDLYTIIQQEAPDYSDAFLNVMRSDRFYLGNIVFMRSSLFDSYCRWLFNILDKFELTHPLRSYGSNYQRRVYGFLGERLLSVWIEGNPDLRKRSLGMFRSE